MSRLLVFLFSSCHGYGLLLILYRLLSSEVLRKLTFASIAKGWIEAKVLPGTISCHPLVQNGFFFSNMIPTMYGTHWSGLLVDEHYAG